MGNNNSNMRASRQNPGVHAPADLMGEQHHMDPRSNFGLPDVNPLAFYRRTGIEADNIIFGDGRGEDPRASMDHLVGASMSGSNMHPRAIEHYIAAKALPNRRGYAS